MYYELPEDEATVKWVESAPLKGYEFVKVNEATNACEKKITSDLKKKCYARLSQF